MSTCPTRGAELFTGLVQRVQERTDRFKHAGCVCVHIICVAGERHVLSSQPRLQERSDRGTN